MTELRGKRLLVVGGAAQHYQIVSTAKEMGIITYVTDYLDVKDAPAKQIADKWFKYNISDIDEIVTMCQEEHIDGVIALYLDACQKPYQQICEKLGIPCFGTKEQFQILTDKNAFKIFCIAHGVDVIPEYDILSFSSKEICEKLVHFPILIKPCDSRGSRGQTICYTYEETAKAIRFAQSESPSHSIVIERYMGNQNDIQVSYIIIDGEPYLTRLCDRHLGSHADKLNKCALALVTPSKHKNIYMEKVDSRVKKMLMELGLRNAPAFMQGFIDGETVRFYDPGLRFPGDDYDRSFGKVYGIDVIKLLLEFALAGRISENAKLQFVLVNPSMIFTTIHAYVRPGKIGKVEGIECILKMPEVVSIYCRYKVGDTVGEEYNVSQRFCEVDFSSADKPSQCITLTNIFRTLKVYDEDGNDMIFSVFNPEGNL